MATVSSSGLLTSSGLGSGIDIEGIISKLISAEKSPELVLLTKKEANVTATLTGLGTFKSALSSFEDNLASFSDATTFNARKATSSDTSAFTVSADSTAVSGSYSVEVTQLAKQQKLISSNFATSATTVGSGTLTIATQGGANSFNVTITASSNDTLAGIRDAINESEDNTGVVATIISVDDGAGGTASRLVLTADDVGTDNTMTVTVVDDDGNNTNISGLSQLVHNPPTTNNMTELQEAKDAIIEIEGQTLTNKSSNVFTDPVSGVTLTVVAQDPGQVHTLTVAADNSSVTTAVNKFVAAYNTMMDALNSLDRYDSSTQTAGSLLGDSSLRSVKSNIIKVITSAVSGLTSNVNSLGQIGLHLDSKNKLVINRAQLDAALSADFNSVSNIISGDDGISTQLKTIIEGYTVDTTGIIDTRRSGLDTVISSITDQRTRLDAKYTSREQVLRAKFTAMDSLLSSLNSTSAFLTQQFDAINANNSN